MSVAATNRVWRQSSKGGALLLLLLAMADWADDWGYCYPSLEQMAGKCRQTERNILNLIADLEGAGELRRVARGKGGRGQSYTSVYQVTTGFSPAEIAASEQSSPLARSTLARLERGEMHPPAVRRSTSEMDEKVSGENFSAEKEEPLSSPVLPCVLKELININDSASPPPRQASKKAQSSKEQAEALYRLVRPTHLTLPNSEQRDVVLKVLDLYLQRYGSTEAAAAALKPFAAEADARGIRPTNLCWLSEWAAVGQIPRSRSKSKASAKAPEQPIDYGALRKRMEVELPRAMPMDQGGSS